MVRALEGAARRGARVSVRLEGQPYADARGEMARGNRAVAKELRGFGASVTLAGARAEPVHMKAVLVDGIAYLDDRNFPSGGRDTIVATSDVQDVALVKAALDGNSGADGHLATEKAEALEFEATAIRDGPGDRVDVESEGFGFSPVSKALRERALGGAHVRLLVAAQELRHPGTEERRALAQLLDAGVTVRVGTTNEKLCVAGDRGWVGSANATFPEPILDWGMDVRSASVVDVLRTAFERNWDEARPVALA